MLGRSNRLHKNRDIRKVLQKGMRLSIPPLRISSMQNRYSKPRFTVIVGTKVAKLATVRNRFKRVIRAAMHQFIKQHDHFGFDIVVTVVRSDAEKQIISAFESALSQISRQKA